MDTSKCRAIAKNTSDAITISFAKKTEYLAMYYWLASHAKGGSWSCVARENDGPLVYKIIFVK